MNPETIYENLLAASDGTEAAFNRVANGLLEGCIIVEAFELSARVAKLNAAVIELKDFIRGQTQL